MCSNEAADFVIEHLSLRHFYLVLHLFVLVKTVQQGLIDCLVHPVFRLLRAVAVEVAVRFGERDILFDV